MLTMLYLFKNFQQPSTFKHRLCLRYWDIVDRCKSIVIIVRLLDLKEGVWALAKLRIMYWKEIPVQVQAEDDSNTISRQLDERFQQGVDIIAMADESAGTDDYLLGWEWGEYTVVAGTAEEAAQTAVNHINDSMPRDFVNRIRKMQADGIRNPSAGSVDHWLRE